MNEDEIAWLSGIFEGEGNISFDNKTSVRLTVGMTDRDVIDKIFTITGLGTLKIRIVKNPNHKTLYQWVVNRGTDVAYLLNTMLPWFGERRRTKAEEGLVRLRSNRGTRKSRTNCPLGHPYSDSNTYIHNKNSRACRQCGRTRWRKTPTKLLEGT